MSLSVVYGRLLQIADTPSTNDKVKLLGEYLKDKDFRTVIRFALSQDKMFHVKQLPPFKRHGLIRSTTSELFAFLDELTKKNGASDFDKQKLAHLASIDQSTHAVVQMIVNKDIKCGASARLVNKARPGTVNIVPYMRCHTNKKIGNIQYPAIIQEKADGMFVNLMINSKGQIKILTRNGKTVWGLRNLKNIIRKSACKKKFFREMVYTGELLVRKKGKILPRKTGNGILNSCIQKTADQSDADCVIFRCWDCLPINKFYDGYDEDIFISRLTKAKMFVKCVNDKKTVDIVLTKQVSNIAEAGEFYDYIRKSGGEGAVLKNCYGEWKNHTSPDCIKLKNTQEAELKVVAFNSGKAGTKYAHMLGALTCITRCDGLKVSVGSGFSDKERELPPEHWLGKIISVEFNEVINDKNKRGHSLFLPRYTELRIERDEADSLEEIMKR